MLRGLGLVMGTRMLVAIAAVVLVGSPAGCDVDVDPPPDRTSGTVERAGAVPPRGPAPAASPSTVPEELQGTWRLDVYCAGIDATLEKGGFGEIVEWPATSEGPTAGRATMTLALYPEYFEISWLQPDQTWRVGWSGPATVEKGILHLDDRHLEGKRDSFTWSLDGPRLSLRYEAAVSGALGHGSPGAARPVASFSLPWTAVDCPPRQG